MLKTRSVLALEVSGLENIVDGAREFRICALFKLENLR